MLKKALSQRCKDVDGFKCSFVCIVTIVMRDSGTCC